MTVVHARSWLRRGVVAALLLGTVAFALPAQEDAWVLVQVLRSPIYTHAENGYYLHVKDSSATDGLLSATFIIEWTWNPRTVQRQFGWMRPPQKIKPGDVWQSTASPDTTQAWIWTRMGLSREADGALTNAQGVPGGMPLRMPAAHDPDHPYLMIGVDVKMTHFYTHEGGDRPGAAIFQDSAEIARGDPVEYRRVYTAAGTTKATAQVAYTYVYKWGATESEIAPSATVSASPEWAKVVGGGALAAAAAALAAAYWKRRRASGDKSTTPPDGPVGYVLQLSADRFTMQADDTVSLTATVWAVSHTGATSLAPAAVITVAPPIGVFATPATGGSRLVTRLTATKDLAPGTHTLAVTAQAGGSSYHATVSITAGATYVYALELTPHTLNLQRDGSETVRARVKVTGPDPAQCERESQRLGSAITFVMAGPAAGWFAVREASEGGGCAGYLELTIPETAAKLKGPHTATYTAQVDTPSGKLAQPCAITITTSQGFELAMDQRLRVKANDVAGSLVAMIRALDDTIPDAATLIAKATPGIRFTLDGPQAHWLREENGKAGVLRGEVSGGKTPGKEVHPLVEVPIAELTDTPPFSATITASVDIPRFGTLTQAAAVEIVPPTWFVELQPIKDKLKVGMTDAAVFCARVLPEDEHKLPLYLEGTANVLNQHITFYADGKAQPYTYIGEVEGPEGFRQYEVRLGDVPKDADLGEFLDMVAEVTLCGQSASQRFRIFLAPKPTLVAKQKSVALINEGDPVAVELQVKNGEESTWQLRVEVMDTGEVEPAGPPETDDGRAFVLNVQAGAGPEGGAGVRTGTLRVTAVGYDPVTGDEITTEPVSITLKVGQVGLTITPSPVRLASDPQAPPATFKVRVVRFNEGTKAFECMTTAMQSLDLGDWEDGDAPDGANMFTGAGVTLRYQRMEGSGLNQSAVWTAKSKLVIPAPTAVDVLRELTAPGDWGDASDRFSRTHCFIAPVDPTAEMAMRISVEQKRCRHMLTYLPAGAKRDEFSALIERDAKNLGVEGLAWQRRLIWNAARESLAQEAESYLQSARMQDALVQACDWTNYVCGVIVQGLSSAFCPFPTDMFVTMLYGSLPDFAIAVSEGRATQWPGEWVRGIWAGAPEMGVDAAIGMAVNFEDLLKQGMKEFKDPRKAFVGACAVFWSARFVRWYNSTKPDGEPYSFKDAVLAAVRDLVEEVTIAGIAKNASYRKQGIKEPGATDWVGDYDATRGHGYDPKDGRVYHPTTGTPDTRGMPDANLEAARKIARDNNVEIYIRPTNPASKALLDKGALPKPEKIKAKTISELDLELGRNKNDLGKVGYFDPGPNPPPQGTMSAKKYEEVLDRYKQRKQEYVDNQKDFDKLAHDHTTTKPDGTKVTERVEVGADGVVINHTTVQSPDGRVSKTSKPYTGDHDVYDIRGPNGRPLTGKEYDKVMQDLKDSKFAAQHPGHRQWDYTKADKYPPPPKKDASGDWQKQQSKFKKAKGIDEKIRDSHQSTTKDGKPGEGLIKVDGNGDVSGAFHNSPDAMKTHNTAQRAGQAIATADRDRKSANPRRL